MKRSISWMVAVFALSLASCSAYAQPQPSRIAPGTAAIDLSKACTGTRWIAVLRDPNKQCPDSRAFPKPCKLTDSDCLATINGTPAYRGQRKPDPQEEKARAEALRDAGLDRFCLYDSQNSGATGAPLQPSTQLLSLDKDCRSTASLGSDLQQMTWSPLQTQFLQQTGRASTPTKPGGGKVRLAIVDSQPTGEGPPTRQGCSPHGYTLAHMAQKLVCTSADSAPTACATQVTTRLAFNKSAGERRSPGPGEACEGGLVGWIADLAPAIVEEIDAWRAKDDGSRLVLNLSVGWDPTFFGGLKETSVEQMKAPVQAVYRALQYAAKRGALVVAAAGNATPGPTPHEGPILPAAWEGWQPRTGSEGKGRLRPLVYAVGGVRWNDYPLSNTRPKAMPSRVAYGDHGVVRDPNQKNAPTAVLTGTSVSTLVVSSAAALAWADKPGLSPAALMSALENTWGYPINSTADFGTQAGGRVKRICIGGRTACRDAKSSFSYSPTLDGFLAPTMDASLLTMTVPGPESKCKTGKEFRKGPGSPPASLCPCDRFESASLQPWVEPQPDENPCPYCSGRPPGPPGGALLSLFPPLAGAQGPAGPSKSGAATLYVDIPDTWWKGASSLETTTLELAYSNGDQEALTIVSYSLNQSFSPAGPTSLRVDNLVPPPLANPILRSATLNFLILRDGQKMSVSSPLFFSP